jgi:hypothetical protein
VPNEEDTSQELTYVHVCARSDAHATVASDILLQLLTTCESRNVFLDSGHDSNHFPVSGLAFSHVLVQSHNLSVLRMIGLDLDSSHCRAIDGLTRTDLRIDLAHCKPTDTGEEILLECIRQNRGPTELTRCRIDTRRLAGALRGNNSVTTQCSDEERLVLVQALAENERVLWCWTWAYFVIVDLGLTRITRTNFGLPQPRGDQLRATRNLRKFAFLNLEHGSVLGDMGRRMHRRLSECKPWWMRFA